MSANPEIDGVVSLRPVEEEVPPQPGDGAADAPPQPTVTPTRAARPAWFVPAAIAAVGAVVAAMLGYVLFTTIQQRDGLQRHLGATQATLRSTQASLAAAQSDAASRKVTADYVAVYVADEGKVDTDYLDIVNCNSFGECRTAAQQLLSDMQKFQSDRSSAEVPSALSSSDSSTGDALSAGIAADQEFITGIDNNDENKANDGGAKLDAAMLNMAKAQASLGTELH